MKDNAPIIRHALEARSGQCVIIMGFIEKINRNAMMREDSIMLLYPCVREGNKLLLVSDHLWFLSHRITQEHLGKRVDIICDVARYRKFDEWNKFLGYQHGITNVEVLEIL